MKNFYIFLTGLILFIQIYGCNKEKPQEYCTGTTVYTKYEGDGFTLESLVEYYNTDGFLIRVEYDYSTANYYATLRYDSDNRLNELFISYEGYSKYYYTNNLKTKIEYYDLNRKLQGYRTYEYENDTLVGRHNFTKDGPDTTIRSFYHHGLLDSIVTIKPRLDQNPYCHKLEYSYDANGNQTVIAEYSNLSKESIELLYMKVFEYDDQSNLVQSKTIDKDGNLMYGTYGKYIYDAWGNLIKSEVYNSEDSLIDSWVTEYVHCNSTKLIKPEIE